LKEFRQFVVAATPEEATRLKRSIGPGALYIAGGTTFVPFVKAPVDVLIDISKLGHTGVVLGQDKVTVGATTRVADLMMPEIRQAAPILYKASRRLATPLIRNMATLGGNLAFAFLPSDLTVGLLAAGAEIEIMGDRKRTVRIEDLLHDGWLGGDDLISKVTLSGPRRGRGTGFAKFGKAEVDIAIVNAAVMAEVKGGRLADLRIAVGQSSSMPAFQTEAADLGRDKEPTMDLIDEIASAASETVRIRDDYRASADYRMRIMRVMVARAFCEALEEAGVRIES
jgi:CO/xanthine dehydrogenase FAD-binding subunit